MKKNSTGGIIILLIAAIAAAWLNFEGASPDDVSEQVSGQQKSKDYLLAVSWQPAFCEQRPNKPECRSQRKGRLDTTNFSLHGLWPQPRNNNYCGVSQSIIAADKSGRWNDLPRLDLSDRLRDELEKKMPGYRSNLHRHEWYKHGTCMSGYTAEDYFEISLALLDQLNSSALRDLLADNISRRLDFREISSVFDRAFGSEASKRLILDCYRDNGRRIIQELKISLSGRLATQSGLSELMRNADTVGRSCAGGIVDPVGLQ